MGFKMYITLKHTTKNIHPHTHTLIKINKDMQKNDQKEI